MQRLLYRSLAVCCLGVILGGFSPAQAQPAAPVTPAQAQDVLGVLQDPKKRAEFTSVLETMVKAVPAARAKTAPLAPNSLGAQLLIETSAMVRNLGKEFSSAAEAMDSTPEFGFWIESVAHDPATRSRILDSLWKLGLVLVCARAIEWGLIRVVRRGRRGLANRIPYDPLDPSQNGRMGGADPGSAAPLSRGHRFSAAWHLLRRLPFVLLALVLDLIPAAVFALVGNALLSTPLGGDANARLVVIAIVNAYVICRCVLCVTRAFVSPDDARLRLVMCTDGTAHYVQRWMRRLTVVTVFGFAIAEVGSVFGLYPAAHDLLLKLVGLSVHVMLIVIVMQKRHDVADRLRARRRASGVLAALQNHLAARWHLIAIFYIVALWLVAAAEVRNGYSRLLHFFVVTTAVGLVSRLVTIVALGGLDRLVDLGPSLRERHPLLQPRLQQYQPVLRLLLLAIIGAATLVALLEVWGVGALGWFGAGQLGARALSALVTSGVTILVAVGVWEGTNAGIDEHLNGLTRQAQLARVTRLRTLLPILRTTLLVTIMIIAGLIVLSEIGVNVAPLLAGAGVLGVAIGFGSQKLVQDLITGLFLLLENTMQVGDIVTLGGLTGTVETLSIRTIRLRALDGAVHIIPFSSVTTVTNQTRDFSYALIDLAVGLDEEPDRVTDIVKAVVANMRREPRWQEAITADLEVMGVDAFGDNSWTLRLRIRTEPAERWAVTREFNRRVKYRFDELVIQSPITGYKVQGWLPPGSERAAPSQPVQPALGQPALGQPRLEQEVPT